jgi:hypothetical protein
MARLSSNKTPRNASFNPLSDLGTRFPFNGITPSNKFCPKEYHQTIWKLMEKHLHQHTLIPTSDGLYLTSIEIQEGAIKEMYEFCKKNSLVALWSYLWSEWYSEKRWPLWARSVCEEKVSILKTTMFIEGHWKVIKRDFLYKFFRPRLDLVVYILLTKVIPHQQRKLEQIQSGREKPEWIKNFKSEWKKLSTHQINNVYNTDTKNWICGCTYYLTSRFNICKHLIHQKGPVEPEFFECVKRNNQPPFLIEIDKNSMQDSMQPMQLQPVPHFNPEILQDSDSSLEDCNAIYDKLIESTTKALTLLQEQKLANNIHWAKGIEKNFVPIVKMVEEVERYRRKRTMPFTWKGHTNNTQFLN